MSEPANASNTASPPLAAGDALAAAGAWTSALDEWRNAVSTRAALRPEVEQRLTWFLAETGHETSGHGIVAWKLALASATAALLATVFVLIPDDPGSGTSNLWAAAAWLMILVSAASAVMAARLPRKETFDGLMRRARAVAAQIETNDQRNGPSS